MNGSGKDLFESSAVRGSLVAVVALVGMLLMKYGVDIGDQTIWVEGILGLVGIVGGLWAVWGRYKAKLPITSVAGRTVKRVPEAPNILPDRRKGNRPPPDYPV